MALNSILATPVSPPPKPASSNSSSSSSASHSSFGADDASNSSSASQSSSSSNSANTSDNGNATRNSGKNASSRNNASSQAQQTQNSSSSSQSKQSSSTSQAQSANGASNGNNGAAQSNKSPAASFLQALAQTQADAQDSVSATATATPQAITGKGKGKATKDDSSTDSSASFGFLSQSLVAAMAGIQQPSPTQGATDGDDSVDGVSLSSGTSAQSLVATLMQNTADDLKAAGGDDGKSDAASNAATTTPSADANAAVASAFQSHLGVSSHLQTSATQDAANSQVNTPVGADGFADEVGDKITWMAHQGVQSASLKMTPENMGPVEVRISVQDGTASVAFNAAHADTRAALEQALPRLREMFSTQGLNLSDASVSQQFSRGQPQKQAVNAIGPVASVSDETTSSVVSVASARLGLLDTYA